MMKRETVSKIVKASGVSAGEMECKQFTQIRVPTEANAAESNLDPQEYVQRMNKAYDIDCEMVGTFHIAVGANNMFGGENKASDHIDFVGCGKIEVIL
ncbi:hypothetical protein [Acetivibrio ethanolgignens]|nr:hypothetical protein [Acetivibrio ethanolgignens]